MLESLELDALPDTENDPAAVDRIFAEKPAAEWECTFDRTGVWYTRVARFDRGGDVLLDVDGGGGGAPMASRPPVASPSAAAAAAAAEQPATGAAGGRGLMSRVAEQAAITGGFLYERGGAVTTADTSNAPLRLRQKLVANPIQISTGLGGDVAANPAHAIATAVAPPAPLLAEHTEDIMLEAVSREEYESLRALGAFGAEKAADAAAKSNVELLAASHTPGAKSKL